MGNNHGISKSQALSQSENHTGKNVPENSNDSENKHTTQMLPVERLTKILLTKSQQLENTNGITLSIFSRYLFPRYPVFAEKFFNYLLLNSKSKTTFIPANSFKQQCEKYLGILDDDVIRDTLVKMYSIVNEDFNCVMTPELLESLLMSVYHISMDHYSEGPQMCLNINKTLKAVVSSVFHSKQMLSSQFVSHWIAINTPRLLFPLHRYAVHSIATSWRTLEENEPTLAAGLELTTPILEQPPPIAQGHKSPHNNYLLHMSMSWLLAGALPPLYSRPQKANTPNNSGTGLASKAFLTKLLCAVPSHWTNLYDSDEHGLGSNRFLHHVMSYKGPTLILMQVEGGQVFCIASPCEWKESHLYWGGDEAAVYQLLPKFLLLEKGPKILYFNLSIRGYPLGLRAGSDSRTPIINVDAGFEKLSFQKIPYNLQTIEVWGCGDQISREKQLEVKKWEVKEAERQRCVKLSAADWLDHPDRYLLELAGRPQYSSN